MQTTKIEWCRNPDNVTLGMTCNFYVGCSAVGCAVGERCYARRIAKRMKHMCDKCYRFLPHLHLQRLEKISRIQKPTGFFLSMGELFDQAFSDWVIQDILNTLGEMPQHRFYLLTKQAHRLPDFKYPPNIWLGVSVNTQADTWRIEALKKARAHIKFISFEPLYENIVGLDLHGVNLIIIGAETSNGRTTVKPASLWVADLISLGHYHHAKVFLKDNLGMHPNFPNEFPEVVKA